MEEEELEEEEEEEEDDDYGEYEDDEEQEAFTELVNWARARGALGLEQVKLTYFDKGGRRVRGLAAATEVTGPILLPRSLLLTADTEEELAWRVATEDLMMRSGAGCFWEPWLQLLPSREELEAEHPLFCSAELLETFAALPCVKRVQEFNAELSRSWEGRGREAESAGLTFADLKWGSAVVLSRCFPPPPTLCFMPLACLMNSGSDANMDVYDMLEVESSQGGHLYYGIYPVEEGATVAEGAELLQAYSKADNSERLFRSGFLQENNPTPLAIGELGPDARAQLEKAVVAELPEAEEKQPVLLANLRALARELLAAAA